ncbi:uncharacterized protein LOC105209973 [Zeugodacus cucurbitae]|uniref:Zonadhesin n=1 Tax=Zeugodacus cucurbitae TaxID=28588 RepID=A0A0A1X0X4_ZEUCU|nr:uncharacterized protein LOC105209973 [Zeugodacus cucurbitae]
MKLLVIFAAALLGVQAVRVPYVVTDANGEKYQILLPQSRQGPVYNHPAFDYKPNDYEMYLSPLDEEEVNLQPSDRDLRKRPVYDYSAEDYHWPQYRQVDVSAARRADSAKQSDSDSSEEDESRQERRGNARRKQTYGSGSNENEDRRGNARRQQTYGSGSNENEERRANARRQQTYGSDSNENDEDEDDEYSLILPHALQEPVHVPGLGMVSQAPKKVKVKVPYYADAFLRQQIIEQYLAAQGLNPEGFDVRGLVARGVHADEPREHGWDLQYSDNQQSKARKFRRPINLQQLMYVTVPERKRRQAIDVSNTANPNDITTVPDVTEISTIAEATTNTELPEGLTVTTVVPLAPPTTLQTVTLPSTSVTTSEPTILLPAEPELLIPLFGYGSILPAEVSRVPLVPRIPLDTAATTSSTTELPLEAVLPVNTAKVGAVAKHMISTQLLPVHSRSARAVPFEGKVRTQLTKVTPVPPLPNTEVRGPKMSDLPHARTMRAVHVAPPVTEVNAVVVEVKTEGTKINCDIQCTKFDLNPVCAFNGECYHEFANQCAMETFICKRPDLGFTATPRERCVMHWLKRCTSQDLKIE